MPLKFLNIGIVERGLVLSDETAGGKRKKKGWLSGLGAFFLLAIIFGDDDNEKACSIGDDAFLRVIGQAIGDWKVGDYALYPTGLRDTRSDQAGVVQFSAEVATDNGWHGTAFGRVGLQRCRAEIDRVQ